MKLELRTRDSNAHTFVFCLRWSLVKTMLGTGLWRIRQNLATNFADDVNDQWSFCGRYDGCVMTSSWRIPIAQITMVTKDGRNFLGCKKCTFLVVSSDILRSRTYLCFCNMVVEIVRCKWKSKWLGIFRKNYPISNFVKIRSWAVLYVRTGILIDDSWICDLALEWSVFIFVWISVTLCFRYEIDVSEVWKERHQFTGRGSNRELNNISHTLSVFGKSEQWCLSVIVHVSVVCMQNNEVFRLQLTPETSHVWNITEALRQLYLSRPAAVFAVCYRLARCKTMQWWRIIHTIFQVTKLYQIRLVTANRFEYCLLVFCKKICCQWNTWNCFCIRRDERRVETRGMQRAKILEWQLITKLEPNPETSFTRVIIDIYVYQRDDGSNENLWNVGKLTRLHVALTLNRAIYMLQ